MTNKNNFGRGILVSVFSIFLIYLALLASGCTKPTRQPALQKSAKATIVNRV